MAIDQSMHTEKPALYGYRAKVRSIYDADTMRVDIDLGCNVWINNEPIRLYGINAYELRGEEREQGIAARAFVLTQCGPGDEIMIRTYKDEKGKYGRWLAVVWLKHPDGGYFNLNQALVNAGHAREADY